MPEDRFSQTSVQLRAASAGDRDALEDLLRRYLPRVQRIVATRMGRNAREMVLDDDIVQETFLDAFRAIEAGQLESDAAFCSWLSRVVQNRILDEVRRGQSKKRGAGLVARFSDLGASVLTASILGGGTATPSEHASARETEERLERLLAELDERYREVLCLRIYCEMSHREIAASMNLPSENTANALFLRARKELQRRLEA